MLKACILGTAVILSATPAYADKLVVADAVLDGISAKASNQTTVTGNDLLKLLLNGSGSIQVGSFQWSDDHSTDGSNHKGANDQSGMNSAVQQNVTATINTLAWGSVAQVATVNTAPVHGDQVTQAWSTMFLGGF